MDKLVQVAALLRPSKLPLRAMFHQIFQFVGSIEQPTILINVNQTVLDFVGFTRSRVIGRPRKETCEWTISIIKSVKSTARCDRLPNPSTCSFPDQSWGLLQKLFQQLLVVGIASVMFSEASATRHNYCRLLEYS
ncbi:diguanylate cyclase with PAS/PAC and GAF sensors [Cylindrospermum sp. NIES-4074]|nr:diguanylate cyclase with PAS/PAC and GAF sensors [Cylindrospermum sp. NIES-4074]